MGTQDLPVPQPARPKLLDQVRNAIRRRHYSYRTEETYIHWIKRFIYFHQKRHPGDMGEAEVTAFLNHLARERKVTSSTQNQALSAIVFLYREALGRPLGWLEGLEWARRPARVPTVLTAGEAQRVLAHLEGTKWIMASLLYGSGLRLRECLKLRVKALHEKDRADRHGDVELPDALQRKYPRAGYEWGWKRRSATSCL